MQVNLNTADEILQELVDLKTSGDAIEPEEAKQRKNEAWKAAKRYVKLSERKTMKMTERGATGEQPS